MAARRRRRRKGIGLDFLLKLMLVAVLGFIVGYFLFYSPKTTDNRPAARPPTTNKSVEPAPPSGKGMKEAKPALPRKARPRVAVIIDDIGMNMAPLEDIEAMGAPVAVAVLPQLRHSADAAKSAKAAGVEILLHLPMQPNGESMKGLGPGALLSGMTAAEMRDTIKLGMESVPGAVGVNNHMGSGLTCDGDAMAVVMAELKKRGLYFVDSRTSSGTVAENVARKAGVRAAGRDVFLDDIDDPIEIKRQFDRMVAKARKNGSAIGIGHPRPATLRVLADELPRLKARGIDVVKVSELVR